MSLRILAFALAAVVFWNPGPAVAAVTPADPAAPSTTAPVRVEDWLTQARQAEARGLLKKAVEAADQAVKVAPTDPRGFFYRAQLHERLSQLPEAEADLTRVLELTPGEVGVLLQRAMIRLRRADFAGSVTDYDEVVKVRPQREADLWQRGIALFYAGKFPDGRRQFERHRTVNPGDVENSAWHFACIAQTEGFEAARLAWLPVVGDPRIPMDKIQALYTGAATPAAVLETAQAVTHPGRRAEAVFYAHLYLALYHGAEKRPELETRHAAEAARLGRDFGVMGEVARLHADWVARRLRQGKGP